MDSVDSSFISTGTDLISELQSLIEGSRGVSGLMIFTAIAILIVDIPVIVGRFTLLLGIGWLRILHVVVSCTEIDYIFYYFADATLVDSAFIDYLPNHHVCRMQFAM